jgi:hypothetical protein
MNNRLITTAILAILACTAVSAQVRTGTDIDSKTFVIGLDSYVCGEGASVGFTALGKDFTASVSKDCVSIRPSGGDAMTVYDGALTVNRKNQYQVPVIVPGEYVVGYHDFTGDNSPELTIGVRDAGKGLVEIFVLQYDGTSWKSIGEIAAKGEGVSVIRIFRQAITVKNPKSGALYTWTWHSGKFDFKASDGTSDPSVLF